MKQFRETLLKISVVGITILFVFYIFTSQMFSLQFHRRYVYLMVSMFIFAGVVIYSILKGTFIVVKSLWINLYFLGLIACLLVAAFSGYSLENREVAFYSVLQIAFTWFAFAYFQHRLEEGTKLLDIVIFSIKAMCLIHCCYILLQYIVYKICGMNLNQHIFVEILDIDYTGLLYSPDSIGTGFTFSQPLLGPMFILGLLLYKNLAVRILIVISAFICRSTTSVVGVLLCIGLLIILPLFKGHFSFPHLKDYLKKKIWIILFTLLAIIILLVAVFYYGFKETLLSEWNAFYTKLIVFTSASGEAHFLLFKDWIVIWKNSNWYQVLFGYGNNCSSIPLTAICGEARFPLGTIAECDLAETAISRGAFGLISTYGMLVYLAIKGTKWNVKYLNFAICMFVMSIGYNVQWPYLMFFLIVSILSVQKGYDVFERADKVFPL